MKIILGQIKEEILCLKKDLEQIKRKQIDLYSKRLDSMDYKVLSENRLKKEINVKMASLDGLDKELDNLKKNLLFENLEIIQDTLKDMIHGYNKYDSKRFQKENEKLTRLSEKLYRLTSEIALDTKTKRPKLNELSIKAESLNIPSILKAEIIADIDEMIRCFESNCFRAATIICGRILETVLHRKYFEVTQNDVLETNPGIGLGKLIAKLKEKKVFFDPGLMDQIHLINKIRIYSVHRKQEVFEPSKEQTQAMILYTIDIVKRLSLS